LPDSYLAGFGYEFLNETYHRLVEEQIHPSAFTASNASLMTPLLFDPGERWENGTNIDWCGLIVEQIRRKRLGEMLQARVFAPLGMTDTGLALSPSMRARLAPTHVRDAGGSLTPMNFGLPLVGDYMRFIRCWLNDRAGENGRVLRAETVQMAVKNGLGDLKIRMLHGVNPTLPNDVEFFPGLSKSWALTFMVNDTEAPTGRPAGAIGWAALGNLYWIGRQNGIGGFWATQILPFGDPVSFSGYLNFETAVYRKYRHQEPVRPVSV
jgi:methyl acetate hydrolase